MVQEGEVICCPAEAPAPVKPVVPNPVAEFEGTELQGIFESLGGFEKVYVTGPDKAEHAIVVAYDIFGFWETTLRGSDLLVSHLLLTAPHRIFMPDLFRGHPFPKEEDGNKEKLQKFFAGTAKLEDRLPETINFARYLKDKFKFKTVSLLGYCWGGKLTLLSLSSTLPESTPFNSGAIVHPAMLAAEDGENLAVPLGFFPSKDEPQEIVDKISQTLKTKPFAKLCSFHHYKTVHHGWAAARANLKDTENLKQYNDVYQRLADFFASVNT